MSNEELITIATARDVIVARQKARRIAVSLGFRGADLTMIALAISELARNIITFAGSGELSLFCDRSQGDPGIVIQARDKGPGVRDLDAAMMEGFSTHRG